MHGGSWGVRWAGRRQTWFGLVGSVLICFVLAWAAPAALASANLNWGAGVEGTLPANANLNPLVGLNELSCASVGNCVAVGAYSDNATPSGNTQGLLLSEVSGTWQQGVEATLPSSPTAASNPHAVVDSVSCPSAGNCTAVGEYNDTSVPPHREGFLLSEVSGTWQPGILVIPPGDAVANPNIGFGQLSCSSPGNCSAIGRYDNAAGTQGLLLSEVSGTWSAQTAPLPSNHATSPGFGPEAISCTSAGNCVAIANYQDTSNHSRGVLLTESSGTWSDQEAPLPPNVNATNPGVGLFNVSCPSAGGCAADGDYTDSSSHQQVLLLNESSGSWTAVEGAAPSGAGTDPSADMDGLSCVSAGNCTGTGEFSDSAGHSHAQTFTQSSGTWAAGVAPSMPNAATDPSATFDNVKCWSAGTCGAVGEYNDSSGHRQGLLVTELSGVAQPGVTATPPPSAGTDPLVSFAFRGLSCPAAGSCTAVGIYQDTSGSTQALLMDARPSSPSLSLSAPASLAAGASTAAPSVIGTLSGGSSPVGTITFKVFGPQSSPPSDCSIGGTTVGTATASSDGTYNPGAGFTPSSGGDYWWYASYGGDPSDNPAASTCGAGMAETVVDGGAPSISIASPADGASYIQGHVVNANYSCGDPFGAANVATCAGPVASGRPIDTSTLGAHSFVVSATDKQGNAAAKTVHYTVVAPPTGSTPEVLKNGPVFVKARGATFRIDPGMVLYCPASGPNCAAKLTATFKRKNRTVVIARASYIFRAGNGVSKFSRGGELIFRLNRQGASLLRKLGRLRITVTVVSSVKGSRQITTTRTFNIKLPGKHKKHRH